MSGLDTGNGIANCSRSGREHVQLPKCKSFDFLLIQAPLYRPAEGRVNTYSLYIVDSVVFRMIRISPGFGHLTETSSKTFIIK